MESIKNAACFLATMVNESVIKKSFLKIKQEMEKLRQENQDLNQDIARLKTEIYDPSFTNKIADSIITRIEQKLDLKNTKVEKNNTIPNNIDSSAFVKLKIKKKIIELCMQKTRPGNLKVAIVDIAKLCSKATFYRYITELKRNNTLETIEINNEVFLVATSSVINRNIYK